MARRRRCGCRARRAGAGKGLRRARRRRRGPRTLRYRGGRPRRAGVAAPARRGSLPLAAGRPPRGCVTKRIDAPTGLRKNRAMLEPTTLGSEFAHALQPKDAQRLGELLAPDVDFRAVTPNYSWEANSPDEVVSIVFGRWFEDSDEIRALERVETDEFADRERVGYRFSIENPEGRFLVEQQAYLSPT